MIGPVAPSVTRLRGKPGAEGSVPRGREEVGGARARSVCCRGARTRREPPLQPPEKEPVAVWRAGVARSAGLEVSWSHLTLAASERGRDRKAGLGPGAVIPGERPCRRQGLDSVARERPWGSFL